MTLNNSTKFGHDALIVSKQPGTGKIVGFDGIRIHAGKNSGFTEGCILIGTSDTNTDNQFTDYNSLPFDKDKLGGRGNSRWTPKKLREFIKLHGGMATLTIKRNYPSQSLCDREEQQKDHVKACLGKLKTSRNTIILYHKIQSDGFISVSKRLLNSIEESDVRVQSTSTVFKPFPAAKSGGAGR